MNSPRMSRRHGGYNTALHLPDAIAAGKTLKKSKYSKRQQADRNETPGIELVVVVPGRIA